jgi:hypothetical protein
LTPDDVEETVWEELVIDEVVGWLCTDANDVKACDVSTKDVGST